ncbi:unnamed protein product [Allacma fusca]|uniref:Uncharacterized protein n=1 Tax=Allacma fusca TaxID=39272 RepID=A0A8J2JNI0_9HEXA|nr:unnamed protein product [Allacma fusca]
MATKYSYNLAREESLKPTNSTAPAPVSPFTIFKDVSARLFTTPSRSPVGDEDKLPALKFNDDPPPEDPQKEEDLRSDYERTFERILQEENKRLLDFIQEILPASENPKEDFQTISNRQVEDLKEEIKILEMKLRSLEEAKEKEKEDLRMEHVNEIALLKAKHLMELGKVEMENQMLIDEIINYQIDEILCWRLEFEKDCSEKGEIWKESEVTDGTVEVVAGGGGGSSQKLLDQFKDLNPVAQGIVIAGMGIATLVIGYYSWPFLNWAWPRLVAFAMDIRVLTAATWVYNFIGSSAYKEFMDAWERGEPLTPLLFKNFGPDIVTQIVKLAPMLFRMKKSAGIIP